MPLRAGSSSSEEQVNSSSTDWDPRVLSFLSQENDSEFYHKYQRKLWKGFEHGSKMTRFSLRTSLKSYIAENSEKGSKRRKQERSGENPGDSGNRRESLKQCSGCV